MQIHQRSLSINSTFILLLLLVYISGSSSKPPPTSSAGTAPSTSPSPSSLLSSEEHERLYNEAYEQAVDESDLLGDEEDEAEQKIVPVTSEPDSLDEEELDLESAGMESFVQAEVETPAKLDSPSNSLAACSFSILEDSRRAVETAIREQLPEEHAKELLTALARIQAREGWQTALELESQVVRIQAWQDVLLAELEAQGTLPEFARLFTQPAERYTAPILSQYAWPPLYALERDGGYTESLSFGEGGTLTESIVRRMGELDSASIVGNLDVSYIAFPGSCTGRHPLTLYLSDEQRSALDRFHVRVYREVLRSPRVIVMNGGDVEQDLVLPLVAARAFDSDTVTLSIQFRNLQTTFEIAFIRSPGSPRQESSILIRRRHPQALASRSRPSLVTQLNADIASELIRALANRGQELPSIRAFLASLAAPENAPPGASNEPLEPARSPLEYRLSHLSRVERGMKAPFSIEGLRFLDFELAQAVTNILDRLPEPSTSAIPCPEHIARSPLQQAHHRLLARASETRTSTYSLRRKVRWKVTLTDKEKQLLKEADARAAKAAKEAKSNPKQHQRWNIARRDIKRNRTDAERARALEQDRASYRRRREEMPPEVREGMLAEQSLRSNVRNLDVVSPLDFLSFLPPAPVNPDSSLLTPIASGSNALLPIVGSSSGTFQSPAFQLPSSNFTSASNTLPNKSQPKSLSLDTPGGATKGKAKKPQAKKVIPKIKEDEEEEEEEEASEPAPSGKGKGVKRKKDDDPSMRKRSW